MGSKSDDVGGRIVKAVGRSRIVGNGVCWIGLLAAVAIPRELPAQTGNPLLDRSTPYGSPLDASGNAAQPATQAAASTAAATQSAARVEPVEIENRREASVLERLLRQNSTEPSAQEDVTRRPAPPNEFEVYVERALGRSLPRFGANLLVPGSRDFQTSPVATVPADYVLGAGDKIFIGLTGSVDGTIDAEIDNNGRIFVPKVGSVRIAGTRYADLRTVLTQAIGRQYRDFRVTASVTQLRGLRVYVTGYANNPGAYTVNSLSTMVNALLAAGGPAAGGSFRTVQLMRGGRLVSEFDLYDFVLHGDRSRDAVLQGEDVLYIPPVGAQVAVSGSVNAEAIYEIKPGESLERVLAYAGGTNALADRSRIILYRLSNLDRTGGVELDRAQLAAVPSEGGDLVQVLSNGTLARSLDKQAVVVRVEGEVARPGNYYVSPGTDLSQVLAQAGGLTPRAFVFGTTLERLSVRQQQRTSFREAVQQLELSLAAAPLTADSSIDAGTRATQIASARAALEQLRNSEPDGRVVLNLRPGASQLPGSFVMENSDRLYIPPVPSTVGVFGAVYRPASFVFSGARGNRVRDFLSMAGGPIRAADRGELFVVRANGEVLSKRNGALNANVVPGDVIFVPVRTSSSSVWQRILQISTLVFQLGLSAATVVAVTN